ncbi:Actin-related protein 8 [Armadillidium vulgare]|nr:Actin-related protein 8 [Armadillidium vulgare]
MNIFYLCFILQELSEGQACIVIHPGSNYLRIGRPSDSAPHTILHAIACRKKGEGPVYCDPFITPLYKLDRHSVQEVEECRLKVSHILQSSLTSDGTRRFATPPQQCAAFNKRCQPTVDEDHIPTPELETPARDIIVGDEILSLRHDINYNIHFPYKKGELNIHSGIGGSITAVLSHLETIWKLCL